MDENTESKRLSLLSGNDSTTSTGYKPRKRPKSLIVVQSEITGTRKHGCNRLEKFLILLISLMLVFALVVLCLYLKERKLNERLRSINNLITNTTTAKQIANQSRLATQLCWTKDCIETAADLLRSIDPKVNPCDDFYGYACGKWTDINPPESPYRWDQFEKLKKSNERLMKSLIVDQDIRAKYSKNEAVTKAFTYYDSCMDKAEIERLKGTPLKQLLKMYGSWAVIDKTWNESQWDFMKYFIKAHKELDASPFFKVHVDLDMKNTSVNVIIIDESLLSLSKNGFLKNGTLYDGIVPDVALLRKALKEVMANVTRALGGDEQSFKDMEEVYNFEKQISKLLSSYNSEFRYQKLTIKELQKKTGNEINWLRFLKGVFSDCGSVITEDQHVVTSALDYLHNVFKVLAKTPKRLISNFILWRVVKMQYHQLSNDYTDIYKTYYIRAFKYNMGTTRQDHCLQQLFNHFSLPVSRIYADKRFNGKSKAMAKEIIENMRAAFIENADQVDWMDNKTKQAAKNKAAALVEEVGYPDITMDEQRLVSEFKNVNINRKTYFMNEINLRMGTNLRNLDRIGKPVDFGEWPFPATESNAYYSYNFNQMVFPAGMLQPPFYDSKFLRAVNYGGIGTIMAHEITHGFDDTGKNYNKDGDHTKWWTDFSLINFNKKSQCLTEQYSNYTFYGGPLNGQLTLSENIADNGGLKQAFKAYRNWVREHGEEPRLPGMMLTNEQVFFIAFAQNWCGRYTAEMARMMLSFNNYAPTPWRVNGTLRNSIEFAQSFNCPVGSPMNPVNKCHVW